MVEKKVYANELFFPEVAKILNEGSKVTVRVQGTSMLPFIHGNADCILLEKVNEVGWGDILLCKIKDHYVVHRLIGRKGNHLLLMGDGNCYGKETCMLDDVAGKVLLIIRPDGTKVDCNSQSERRKALLWHKLVFIRRYLLWIYKKFIYRTKIV